MKTIILIGLVALVALVAAKEDYYVVDKIDVNELLTNTEEMKRFLDCMSEKGPCKKEHLSYKANAPDVVQHACRKCSLEQMLFVWQFVEIAKSKLPKQFQEFKDKYDPEHKYFDNFVKTVNKFKDS